MPIDPEILRQVDNAIRSDLQSWRDMFFHLLVMSSGLVSIGVVLEGPELIHEVRNLWRTSKPETGPRLKLIGLLGWVLVVAGVAGEGIFEWALSASDAQIQTFDEILVSEAQRNALSAEKGNIQLSNDLERARAETARAELATEQERIARLKLEEAVAWRRLTKSQIAQMGAAASGYSRQLTAIVYNVMLRHTDLRWT
jgi:hypothetical protein